MKGLAVIAGVCALILAGAAAWVRLAPDDPARWHRPSYRLSGPGWSPAAFLPPGDPALVRATPQGAEAPVLFRGTGVAQALTMLDRAALAAPRTRRLAGSAAEGRITWVARSALWGFPDYITADARAEGADAYVLVSARQRYGRRDFGVNAARLGDWLARLGG